MLADRDGRGLEGTGLTLTTRPADLYSSSSGRRFSASTIVDTMRLTGPGPSPT